MAVKNIAYDQEARERIRDGVRKLARAVKVTLGPRGRNVIIEKSFGSPTVTKDGVMVAKEIELEDKYENLGAQLVKEVASKTSDIAGDGTTTATLLAEAIFEEGAKNVTAGRRHTRGHGRRRRSEACWGALPGPPGCAHAVAGGELGAPVEPSAADRLARRVYAPRRVGVLDRR